jgi:hypothetical protein
VTVDCGQLVLTHKSSNSPGVTLSKKAVCFLVSIGDLFVGRSVNVRVHLPENLRTFVMGEENYWRSVCCVLDHTQLQSNLLISCQLEKIKGRVYSMAQPPKVSLEGKQFARLVVFVYCILGH